MSAPIPVKVYRVIPQEDASGGISSIPTAGDYYGVEWITPVTLPDNTLQVRMSMQSSVIADGYSYIDTQGAF